MNNFINKILKIREDRVLRKNIVKCSHSIEFHIENIVDSMSCNFGLAKNRREILEGFIVCNILDNNIIRDIRYE